MPGNNGSFTDDDEKNLAYMFAQDVRLFIKFLGERCAKDPDNRVKYRWSDKQLEYVRNLYTSASFHRRLCDCLSPQKDREIESSSVVDEYVAKRYPERASRRGKSASPNRGRGKVTGKSTVGRNPYPRVTAEKNPYPRVTVEENPYPRVTVEKNPYPQVHEPIQTTGVTDEPLYSSEPIQTTGVTDEPLYSSEPIQTTGVTNEPLYSSEPLGNTLSEQFLSVPVDTSWIEPEYTFEVIPPSPELQFETGMSRSSSGTSTALVSRETSVELQPFGAVQFPQPPNVSRETSVELSSFGSVQFPQPQIPQIVGQSWDFPLNDPWSTSWNNQKRKRGHEEGPAAKKRRT